MVSLNNRNTKILKHTIYSFIYLFHVLVYNNEEILDICILIDIDIWYSKMSAVLQFYIFTLLICFTGK